MAEILTTKSPRFSIYPLLWLAVFLAFGILAAKLFSFDWKISLAFCLFSACGAIVFIKRKFAAVFLCAAFFFLGSLVFQIENRTIPAHRLKRIYDEKIIESGDPVELEGVLQGKPELAANGFFLRLKAEKIFYKGAEQKASSVVRFFAPASDAQNAAEYAQMNLQYGSRIRVAAHLFREENYLNPGMLSRLKILDEQGIDASATIKSALLIEKIGDAENFTLTGWIYEQRQNLIVEFRDKFSVSTAGVLIASLLGNKYFLDKPTAEAFREGGTFHVLVISGLHITFIGGLTVLFLRFFTRKRFWQFVVACSFLWIYTLAVGAEVPVVRATVMFTILLFSQVIYRNGTLLNSLGACALVFLVWRPNDLFASSFQLTFASVAAIVACAFPLIENLRNIGKWTPSAETPFPPDVPVWLKRFCEMLYWEENRWKIESGQQIWSAKLFKKPYLEWLEAKNLQGFLRYLFEAVLISIVVQVWLLPFLIIYFHRISVASILLNIWVGFFIAFESFAAVIGVILAQISGVLAFPFIKLTEIFNSLLLFLPDIFIENSWASFRVPHYSGEMKLIYFVYFLPVLILTIALNVWNPFELRAKFKDKKSRMLLKTASALLLIFIGVIVFHPFSAPKADGKLRVDFLDVGQGDSALVTFPSGKTLLIDAGGKRASDALYVNREDEEPEIFEPDTQSVGETVVSAFLWERGYSKIDYILATHADADHIQGLTDVAKNFQVRAAFFGRLPAKNEEFAALLEVLQKREIEIIQLKRGDVLDFENVKMEILHPQKDFSAEAVSDNNHSLVLRLIFGNKKILFTGDVEREAERELLQNPLFLQADFVKVAHHGSRTSSTEEFVEAAKAEYAIIPVGNRSPFGHPHEEVLERWRNSGAKILRTGERGTITVLTDGKNLEIQTFQK
jgi:competence protein ComEC